MDSVPDSIPVAHASAPSPVAASARSRWLLFVVAFATMILFGFVENLKGPLIPPIRQAYGVSYGDIGAMLFVSTLGYLSATFVGGLAGDRFGLKRVLVAGYVLIAGGAVSMLIAPSFVVVCGLMFMINAGFGCLEVGVNALGARLFVRNAAFLMNLVHLFYGLGSVVGPEYAAWMLVRDLPWSTVYAFGALLVLVLFAVLMAARFPSNALGEAERRVPLRVIAADRKVWLFVAVLGFSEVVELGTGNWLVSYLRGAFSMDAGRSAQFLSLFFVSFTIGRLIGGYLMERIGYVRGMRWFLFVTVVVYACAMAVGEPGAGLISVAGFFISILFPTVMAVIMKEYPASTSSVMGFIITASGGVNMLFNWVIGQTSDLAGVTVGFGSLILYAVLAMTSLTLLDRRLVFNKAGISVGESAGESRQVSDP